MKREKSKEKNMRIKDLETAIKNHCFGCNNSKIHDCFVENCELRDFRPYKGAPKSVLKKN
jgi:hypothetical protein